MDETVNRALLTKVAELIDLLPDDYREALLLLAPGVSHDPEALSRLLGGTSRPDSTGRVYASPTAGTIRATGLPRSVTVISAPSRTARS